MTAIGEIKLFPYDDVPSGYLKCDGRSLKVKEYPKLFMMIGTKYGKADEVHFTLPDMKNSTPKGMIYCIAFEGEIPNI